MRRGFVHWGPDDTGNVGGGGGGEETPEEKAAREAAEAKASAGTDDGSDGKSGTSGGSDEGTRTMTQAQLDAIIQREKKKAEKSARTKWDEEQAAKNMTDAERVAAEAKTANETAAATVKAANGRLVKAEAKAAALGMGVATERLAHVLRIADLSSVDVDDEGEVDVEAIKLALSTVKKDIPELFGATKQQDGTRKSGGDFKGGDQTGTRDFTPEEIDAMSPAEFDKNQEAIAAWWERQQ